MIALARILAAVATAAETVAVTGVVIAAVGDGVADAIAADARRPARRAGAICLPRNMHHRKVASPADMTIAADSRAVTTIGVRKRRAARPLP